MINGTHHDSGIARGIRESRVLGPDGLPYRADAPEAGFAVGHNVQFSAILSSGFRAYWHNQFDQAIRHSKEDALAMRNDAWLMAILQERKLATASLAYRIEVDNERDPHEKAVQEGLLAIVRRTPNFRKLVMYLLEAIWYGRYGSQILWDWETMPLPSLADPGKKEAQKALVVKNHLPVNGDKIGHHWDGTPYISINPAYSNTIPNADITPSTSGAHALYLRGSWRNRFIIHTHEAVDADYFDAQAADAVHGLGVRSVVYCLDWLRKEWLGNVADWCERTGLGIRLWYYQANNPASKREVERAARDSNDRTNIFIPRTPTANGKTPEGVEFVDTSSTGADLLLKLQEHLEEHIERFIIGQSLSGGRGAGDGLGGEGKSKLARDTKGQIVAYDAGNLGETLTRDLLRPIQWWTWKDPKARNVNARLVFAVDDPDPQELLGAVKTFVVDLGGKVRMAEVQAALGLGAVHEGDEVISLESIRKQQGQTGPPGGPGMPPGGPGQPGLPSPGGPGGQQGPGAVGSPPGGTAPPSAAGDAGQEDVAPKGGGSPPAAAGDAGQEDVAPKGDGVSADPNAVPNIAGGRRHYQYLGRWQRSQAAAMLAELEDGKEDLRQVLTARIGMSPIDAEAAIDDVQAELRRRVNS